MTHAATDSSAPERAAPGESQDSAADLFGPDLDSVRLGQARLLLKRTVNSCLIVEGVILYFTALIAVSGHAFYAALWFALTSAMVLTVFLYSRLFRDGVTPDNQKRYLRGHVVISGITGLVWSGLAIGYLDPSSPLNLFIAVNIVASIALGGMLPSAEYRPSWISLASGMFLPFSIYWLVTVEGPLRLIGVGILILYGFGLLVSARSEMQTMETLAAERNRRLNEKLREQYSQIQQASAEKSRFLAATSHDMSQPLQAQSFFIRAMRELVTTPAQTDLLDKIEAAWRDQRNLLESLVESARLNSGAIIARPSVVALQPLLEGLQAEFSAEAQRKRLDMPPARTRSAVEADSLLVTRIVRNLLSNAVKFTPAGGEVRIDVTEADGLVWIAVSDTGPGIPESERSRVFEEFVQLDTATDSETKGLGLGLSIVRHLAQTAGARLELESEAGQGATIRIGLPRAEAEPAAATVDRTAGPVAGAPLVVLVEDEAQVRDGLAMLLTHWGCRVIAAASGPEALSYLSWTQVTPTLIIADKRLADGENGIEVIGSLREEVLEDVPAVLLTGDIHEFDRVRGMPALTVIPKPANPSLLRDALDEALEEAGDAASADAPAPPS